MLAVEFAYQNPDARDLALYLANQLKSELVGLFFEGEDLLLSAQYPFSREIVAISADERVLDMDEMQRSLRAWSRHMQQQLQAQANKKNIKCSFHLLSNRQSQSLINQAEAFNLLIFSGQRAIHYPLNRHAHTVCVLIDDNSRLQHTTSILMQVIPRGINHILFIDNGGEISNSLIRSTISALDSESKIRTHFQVRKISDELQNDPLLFDALRNITRHHSISFVLLPGGHHLLGRPDLFKLLQQNISCPLVVAG